MHNHADRHGASGGLNSLAITLVALPVELGKGLYTRAATQMQAARMMADEQPRIKGTAAVQNQFHGHTL